MNYVQIKEYDIANGPGVRLSLFVSGCTHHCRDCFNSGTWDFQAGEPFTDQTCRMILDSLKESCYKACTNTGKHSSKKC